MGIFDSLFKKKNNTLPFHFGLIGLDMHSHLLPNIDDGSQSMDETIGMILKFKELGYRKLIITPHIMSDYYKNTPEIILGKLEEVKAEIKRLGIEIQLEAAAEYYFDEGLMKNIKSKNLLTFGDNFVLFEYPFIYEPANTESLIFEFKSRSFKPVLAHFERYPYYHKNKEKASELRDKGVFIQLNINSIFGHYGPDVQKKAHFLIDNQLVDFVSSDCHRIEHLQIMEKNHSNEYLHKLLDLDLMNFKMNQV
jgi:protein-tyrosine phosphatase